MDLGWLVQIQWVSKEEETSFPKRPCSSTRLITYSDGKVHRYAAVIFCTSLKKQLKSVPWFRYKMTQFSRLYWLHLKCHPIQCSTTGQKQCTRPIQGIGFRLRYSYSFPELINPHPPIPALHLQSKQTKDTQIQLPNMYAN